MAEHLGTHTHADVDIDSLDSFGRSALWYAACEGDVEAVQALLAAGANISAGASYVCASSTHEYPHSTIVSPIACGVLVPIEGVCHLRESLQTHLRPPMVRI